jgi:hypothetical protein
MPLKIYRQAHDSQPIAWLSGENDWSLPPQLDTLTQWLEANAANLPPGEYVADIGFCWRRDAGGGGSAISPKTLALMASANMHLHLSEYPGFSDGGPEEL